MTVLYADVWNTVFQGAVYPDSRWANSGHPSVAGYTAIGQQVGAIMPDPVNRPVFAIGDSWLTLGSGQLASALNAIYGRTVNLVIADFFGHDLNYQLGQWWQAILAYEPVSIIHFSGYRHEAFDGGSGSPEPIPYITSVTQKIMGLSSFMGADFVSLGVAPYSDVDASSRYAAVKATLGF